MISWNSCWEYHSLSVSSAGVYHQIIAVLELGWQLYTYQKQHQQHAAASGVMYCLNAVWSVILVLQQSGRCSSASWVKLKTSNLKLYNNVLGKYFNISLAVTRSLSDELVHLIMWINCWSLYYIHCFLKFKPSWKQKRRSAWRLNGISVL